ncbi:Origin recognition complex subunit 3 [Sphaceloma murrayae]|uniref:Origin recognition complex subunit 3 n=1 Tax=Sphaceloma murrayae TaxID=2082308 RepID=A0A2K1QQI6_9PEZI|nr:Origin recognition complex subunit 3 [Sphaceloma murrayae]
MLTFEDPNMMCEAPNAVLNFLPERDALEKYVEAYCSGPLINIFPLLTREHFFHTIDTAYGKTSSPPWRVLVARFAVCAISTFFSAMIGHLLRIDMPPLDITKLAQTSYALFARWPSFPPTIEALQGSLALYFFETARGDTQKVDFLVSMCSRLVYNMGCHMTSQHQSDSSARRDHMRDLFWLCYTIDKDHTFRTGRPPMLVDDHCDLTLPPRYLAYASTPDAIDHLFPTDLRLSMLKAKAHRDLYSVASHRKSDIEIIKTIRELDEELDQWRSSVPASVRPSLAHFDSNNMTEWTIVNLHHLMIRLEYHHVTSIIHQASSRCIAWADSAEMVAEGISSSVAVSVAASRATLLSLVGMSGSFPRPFIWALLFYPMSAILTIFCSILDEPLSPTAQSDTRLLEQMALIMTPDFQDPIADVNINAHAQVGFAREVARLAKSAN